MKIIQEFKEFAVKGNVIDLAVGVIIGAAFGKIVTSLVNDIIMPPIGLLVSGIDFSNLKVVLKHSAQPVSINYGMFIQDLIQFLIIAFVIFFIIKSINRLKRKKEQEPVAPLPMPTREEDLLIQIRDLLKEKH